MTDKIPHTLKGDGKGTIKFITDYEYYNCIHLQQISL